MFDDLDFVSSNQSFPHKKIEENYLITFVFIAIRWSPIEYNKPPRITGLAYIIKGHLYHCT